MLPTHVVRRPAAGLFFLAVAAGVVAQAPLVPKSDLVALQDGEFPVIVSAPHGGTTKVPDVPVRTGVGLEKLPTGAGFVTGVDTGTQELAHAIAAAIAEKTGKKPYLVVAKFARKYIDANRPADVAYDDPRAKPTYDAYHAALAGYCKAVKAKHGRGLLLDVHGQGTSKDTVYRGTANGKSVALLRERFGEKAHTGPKSFFGMLAAGGLKVFPADLTGPEQPGYSGGHITRKYGGGDYGIDAIQLEFGGDHRTEANRRDTATAVAAVVKEFAALYLTDKND